MSKGSRWVAGATFFIAFFFLIAHANGEVISIEDLLVEISFAKSDRRVAERVGEVCRKELPRLERELRLRRTRSLHVVLIEDMESYRRTSGDDLPRWGAAYAFVGQGVMLVDVRKAASSWNSLEKVIPHELSHLLVDQKVGGVGLPVWFMEGVAQWQAREWSLFDNWAVMVAVWKGQVPELANLLDRFPREGIRAREAYRVSYLAMVELFHGSTEQLARFLAQVRAEGDFERAFLLTWGRTPRAFAHSFEKDLEEKYTSHILLFQTAPLLTITAILFVVVYLGVRLRSRRKLREWEKTEGGVSLDDY